MTTTPPSNVILGPWAGPPTRQDPPRLNETRWWERLDDGRLLVLCRGAHLHRDRYQIAPINEWHPRPGEATPTNVIPDRAINRDRITVALDYRGLYGPEVDEALGVADAFDTVVDSWETPGGAVPTETELRRLCMLTGFLPAFFYRGSLPTVDQPMICGAEGSAGPQRCRACGCDCGTGGVEATVVDP